MMVNGLSGNLGVSGLPRFVFLEEITHFFAGIFWNSGVGGNVCLGYFSCYHTQGSAIQWSK